MTCGESPDCCLSLALVIDIYNKGVQGAAPCSVQIVTGVTLQL
jgi:hypothetical protein